MGPSKTVQYDRLTTSRGPISPFKSGLDELILRDHTHDLLRPGSFPNDHAVFEKNHAMQCSSVVYSVGYSNFWRFLLTDISPTSIFEEALK
jgi:hypothetical protein